MRNDELKTGKKAKKSGKSEQPPGNKPLLVRKLTSLEDVRRVQSRLVKEYLAGRITMEVAKTGAYLTSCLTATMKELKPLQRPEGWIGEITIVQHAIDQELQAQIDSMNASIMAPPETNDA